MKLLFKVDQKQALREGKNVQNTTSVVDINPEELTQVERDILADCLSPDGHDCTVIAITEPTVAGVRRVLAEKALERQEHAAEQDRLRQQYGRALRDEIEKGPTYSVRYATYDQEDGKVRLSTNKQPISEPVKLPFASKPLGFGFTQAAQAEEELWDAYQDRLEKARQEISEAPELVALLKKLADQDQARLEQEKREREKTKLENECIDADLHARLPEGLRKRAAARYAGKNEVRDAIQALLLKDAGLSCTPHFNADSIDTLTDLEYDVLQSVKKRAPDGAEVVPCEIYDYRAAEEDDDPDDIDRDGEVKVILGRVALITWNVGSYSVEATVPLG